MGKKLTYTPRSKVKSALRQLWLRSRERGNAVKRDKNTCQRCHEKGTKAKNKKRIDIQVHHLDGIEWEELIDMVYRYLLVHEDGLECLCTECHDKEHLEEE